MLKIQNAEVFTNEFGVSIKKLGKVTLETIKETIDIAKVIKVIMKEMMIIFSVRDKILSEYDAKFDKDKISIKDPSKLSEFNEKISELLNAEFEIPIEKKIMASKGLAKLLTPEDLIALESIIEY